MCFILPLIHHHAVRLGKIQTALVLRKRKTSMITSVSEEEENESTGIMKYIISCDIIDMLSFSVEYVFGESVRSLFKDLRFK